MGANFATLRLDGKVVSALKAGKYTIVVSDGSKSRAFKLVGPGVRKTTSVKGTGRAVWTLTLKKGTYRYSSGSGSRTLRVT